MSVAREHPAAAAVFALLVLAYLWPVLLAGHVLSPAALLQLETPWVAGAPHDLLHYANGDLADVSISYYPWSSLARSLIHAGTFPAWNPYAFSGTPLFANLEIAWASPFSLPLWLLPLNYGLGVAAALKLWTAGFGTYLLARELRLGFWPGVVAGISFALCAFNIIWLSHGVFVSVAALLPWSVWLTERLIRHGRPVDGFALAAVVAIALAGGHPGTQVHVLGATVIYALLRLASTGRRVPRRDRLTRLGLLGAALLVGALLTAAVLLPGVRAAHGTAGALAREHGSPTFVSSHLSPGIVRTALFPDWWGRPSEHVRMGPAVYRERTLYAGAVSLLLALVAIATPGAWRRKGPFVLLGILGIAVALRTPGLWALVIHLPLLKQVQNGRIVLLFGFAVSVLAAFGLQALLDRTVPRRRLIGVAAFAGVATLAAIAASLQLDGASISTAVGQMLHRTDTTTAPGSLALASVGWWLVLIGAAVAILILARRSQHRARLVGGLLALLVAFDMLHFAHGYQPMGPASTVFPPRTPAIAFLQRHAHERRIAGISGTSADWVLAADWSTMYRLHDVRGFDAPYPTLRYARLWTLIDPTTEDTSYLTGLSDAGPKLLGMLGVRYLMTPPGADVRTDDLHVAYDGPDARVFANARAVPRALVVSQVTVAREETDETAALEAAAFDPRHAAVVRRDELGSASLTAPGGGSVRVAGEGNDEVTLEATLERKGLVVLDDQWTPGWSVEVDGRPARALQTDLVLRGVVVPRGRHTVVWRYRVPGLRLGVALTIVGVLAMLGWAGLLLARSRRRAASPPLSP